MYSNNIDTHFLFIANIKSGGKNKVSKAEQLRLQKEEEERRLKEEGTVHFIYRDYDGTNHLF